MRRISILTPILVVVAIAAMLTGCAAPRAYTGSPEAEATAIPTPAPTPVDQWALIQKSGRMTVGTAADYPPFEYYNSRYQLDGFDIGLIREIGKQLGVKVEIKDYAFDGLYNALQLGRSTLLSLRFPRRRNAGRMSISRAHTTRPQVRCWRTRNLPHHFNYQARAVGRSNTSACRAARCTRPSCRIRWWTPNRCRRVICTRTRTSSMRSRT